MTWARRHTLQYLLAFSLATLVCGLVAIDARAASDGPTAYEVDDLDGVCDVWEDETHPDCAPSEEEIGEEPAPCEWWEQCDPAEGAEPPVEEVIEWPAPPKGSYARIKAGSRKAKIPKGAPKPIRRMIHAANRLVHKPYKWGGGHARLDDRGYDCSGAVSYVLRAAGYLYGSLTSGGLAKWGKSGPGKWVRIYAHKDHVFMVIAGLRFDTTAWGAKGGKGPRWRDTVRPTQGFKLRHPPGL